MSLGSPTERREVKEVAVAKDSVAQCNNSSCTESIVSPHTRMKPTPQRYKEQVMGAGGESDTVE